MDQARGSGLLGLLADCGQGALDAVADGGALSAALTPRDKLGLPASEADNRRVMAVLRYLSPEGRRPPRG
jgi:hypothetical protein